MAKKDANSDGRKIVVRNRKARHDFKIEDTFEAGMALNGPEVKSLRAGKANLQDSYCSVIAGEVYLNNCHISPYNQASYFNADPVRPRKLLLHKREIAQLDKAVRQKGNTIIPLSIYFRNRVAKVEIGIARGKKLYDKRADIADRDSKRRLKRIKDEHR
ncbi:MAG: SsrA-binding protein SmpB [Rhodothermales bacterium]|nr:SsrA-binding protein SmpB [Rhodothermales bacterium]